MATGSGLQRIILELEGGSLAVWVQRTVLLALVLAVTVFILGWKFENFGNDAGFDQAQIARQISKGEGFSTQVVRPFQVWFMDKSTRAYDPSKMPEISQAPLYPYFNSLIFNFFKKDYMARGTAPAAPLFVDRAIVLGAILLFLMTMGVVYALGHNLFDGTLALLTVGLCLICNLFWEYAQACLPQLLLLLLFSLLLLCLGKALMHEHKEDGAGKPLLWIIPIGFLGGLMVLTHGLAVWIVAGLLVSVLILFRGRWLYAVVVLASFLAVVTPWLVRNYQVSGHAFGMGHLAFVDGIGAPMDVWQANFAPDFQNVTLRPIQKKVVAEASSQIRNLFENMGFSLVAPLFFISLLHPFRRRETGALRWALLIMFLFLFVGGCMFTSNAHGISVNNLHLIFMPFFTLYGMAFIIITWNRGMPAIPILKYTAVAVLFGLSGLSLFSALVTNGFNRNPLKHWPPYIPYYMGLGGEVATEGEALCTDLPECVAYATNRLTLKMPDDFAKFVDYLDYKTLNKPIVALILTPRTGDAPFISEIAFGRYSRWAKFVMRHKELDLGNFPLNQMRLLPPEYRNVMFIDSAKLKAAEDQGKVPEEPNKANLPTSSPVVPIPGVTPAPPPADGAGTPAPAPTPAQ